MVIKLNRWLKILCLLSLTTLVAPKTYAVSTDPVDYFYKGANYTTYYDNSTGTWKSTGGNSVVVVSAHAHTIPTDQEVREWVRVFSRT